MQIKVKEFLGPMKSELESVVSDFEKHIGHHIGNDHYEGDVAYYIDDNDRSPEAKKEALDWIAWMQNRLTELKNVIEDYS